MGDPVVQAADSESAAPRSNVTPLRALPAADSRDRFPTIEEAREFGKLFKEAWGLNEAEVALKCLMAAELNISWRLGPSALYFTEKGALGMHASSIRAAIRKSGRYDYEIIENDDTKCTMRIVSVPGREVVGTSTYTIEDAQKANITGNRWWVETPKAMLLARATTVCYQNWCPDVFGVPMYDRDALIEGEVKDLQQTDGKRRTKIAPVTPIKSNDPEIQAAREQYSAVLSSFKQAARAAGVSRSVANGYIAEAMKGSDGTPAFAIKAVEEALLRITKPSTAQTTEGVKPEADAAAVTPDPFADDVEEQVAVTEAVETASQTAADSPTTPTDNPPAGGGSDPYTALFEGESAELEIHAALAETEFDEVEAST